MKIQANNQEVKVVSRREKKNRTRWIKRSIGVLVIAGLIFGAFKAGAALMDALLDIGTPAVAEANETLVKASELRAKGEDIYVSMDEGEVLAAMNQMTHQKIKASEKWGAVEMTSGNIQELMILVSDRDFTYKMEILSLLEKWSEGNFKGIDSDHNQILDMQGGTIGAATGVMSKAEEKEFIENAFEEDK